MGFHRIAKSHLVHNGYCWWLLNSVFIFVVYHDCCLSVVECPPKRLVSNFNTGIWIGLSQLSQVLPSFPFYFSQIISILHLNPKQILVIRILKQLH